MCACCVVNGTQTHYAINPIAEAAAKGEERESPYGDGMFQVEFEFQPSYPMVPPKVKFITKVYHPNIKLDGEDAGQMCADFVSKTWKPSETVKSILEKIVALLASPNADEPLESAIGTQFQSSLEEFEKTAREYVEAHCT